MANIVAIMNQKGGTGKTTGAVNIAACLARNGHRVCIADCDEQGSATKWASVNSGKYFDVYGMSAGQLKAFVERVGAQYEYIIIDTPPAVDKSAGKFVAVADMILIAVQPSAYDVWACNELLDVIEARQEATDGCYGVPPGGLPVSRLMFSMARSDKSVLLRETIADADREGLRHMDSCTIWLDIYKKATKAGQTVFDCLHGKPHPNAAAQINRITDEMINVFNEIIDCEEVA